MAPLTQATAQQVLEIVPSVMRTIRGQLRTYRRSDISVPQLRALGYVDRNDGASLSELASYIGLTLPSMSKLVDGLVARRLVDRIADSRDRRRVCISLTPLGREELRAVYRSTERFLANRLASLREEDLEHIMRAMQLLKELFGNEPGASKAPGDEK